jgi:hypothetical protein
MAFGSFHIVPQQEEERAQKNIEQDAEEKSNDEDENIHEKLTMNNFQ